MGAMSRVYHRLRERPATTAELSEELGFARRTVYGVVKQLLDVGEVVKRVDLNDARRVVYVLKRRNRNEPKK